MKHANTPVCPSCEEKMKGACPELREWFLKVRVRFPTAHVSCVWRGKEEQMKMLAEKKSLLPWPRSKHNAMKDGVPCSEAMDLFNLVDHPGKPSTADFRKSYYAQISRFLAESGAPITWGGDWTFSDSPHFELKDVA